MSVNPSGSTGADASHLSIGEVLNILREEFPDATISKIRFLESQGLIDPERTPSGYRKFYESDVSRLRWILHQQKENFLPLKVIKERLDRMGEEQPASVHAISRPQPQARAQPQARVQPQARRAPSRRTGRSENLAPQLPLGDPMPAAPAEGEPAPAADNGDRSPEGDTPSRPRRRVRPSTRGETAPDAPEQPGPGPAAAGKPGLTRTELERTAGLEDWQLNELESFGLLEPVEYDGGEALFDDEGQAIATAAAGFYAHGIGARHLRMYKHFAEREASLFEQVALQYLRQRNPEARAKAREELATLSKLGRALRSALLVQAVRDSIAE